MAINISCHKNNITTNELDTVKFHFLWVSILIALATFIFNIAVIVRLRLAKRHKIFTRIFVTSLAITDILVAILVIPSRVYGYFYDERYILGKWTCQILYSSDMTFTSVSIYHLATLAWERFIAIHYPLTCAQICNRRRLLFLLFLVGLFQQRCILDSF